MNEGSEEERTMRENEFSFLYYRKSQKITVKQSTKQYQIKPKKARSKAKTYNTVKEKNNYKKRKKTNATKTKRTNSG